MSKHIANLKPGETLAFKGPIIKYEYKPNEFAHGVTIGGGQSRPWQSWPECNDEADPA
jgi:NAD(P)H-flavin reductase